MLISPKQKITLKTDNVFLEILNNRLNGITSEMGHIIHKASFTPFIKEAWDFGQGLVSLGGEIFSYPRDIGVAFMVASLMDDAVKAFDDYKPGERVTVLISREDRLLRVPVALASEPPHRWQIEAAPGATAAQRSRLDAWLQPPRS